MFNNMILRCVMGQMRHILTFLVMIFFPQEFEVSEDYNRLNHRRNYLGNDMYKFITFISKTKVSLLNKVERYIFQSFLSEMNPSFWHLINWCQFIFICPVTDHELFACNSVREAVDPRGDSHLQTTWQFCNKIRCQ